MELKKISLFLFFMVAMVLFLGACAETQFSGAEGSAFQKCVAERPEVNCRITCASGICLEDYDYKITTDAQVKDILFVVDVSGSMSDEQAKMGSMFPNFLKNLEDVNYRIAITTTDVRDAQDIADGTNLPSSINGNGAFQDGNLIPFNDGSSFLDGSLPRNTEQRYFEDTITWEQTLTCEENGYNSNFCPSGDERGILAAAMTFDKNPDSFIRPVGHMALVILSDEDEGSQGTLVESDVENPTNFIAYFKDNFPNKSLTVHSIVIQPKNTLPPNKIEGNNESVCYNDQYRPGHPQGYYGNIYAELTALTEDGVLGDICANDANYSDQLKAIGESVSQVREVLPCRPVGDKVTVDFIPDPGYRVDIIKNLSQNEILFSEPLPKGTEIRFRFQCEEEA